MNLHTLPTKISSLINYLVVSTAQGLFSKLYSLLVVQEILRCVKDLQEPFPFSQSPPPPVACH
jgi:hypothetical protein